MGIEKTNIDRVTVNFTHRMHSVEDSFARMVDGSWLSGKIRKSQRDWRHQCVSQGRLYAAAANQLIPCYCAGIWQSGRLDAI
jgi:hypothetical protein